MNAAQSDRIARALRDGRTYREIQEQLGVSSSTIALVARLRDLRRRTYRRRPAAALALARRHEPVLALRRQGLTMAEIADRLPDVSLGGVRIILRRHGMGGDPRLIRDGDVDLALRLRRRGLSWRRVGLAMGRQGPIYPLARDRDPLLARKLAEIEWAKRQAAAGASAGRVARALGVARPSTIRRWLDGGGRVVSAADLLRWARVLPWLLVHTNSPRERTDSTPTTPAPRSRSGRSTPAGPRSRPPSVSIPHSRASANDGAGRARARRAT